VFSELNKYTRRSSRSKRKIERKIGSGRKGTIDEEEYLLKSITKLVTRFDGVQGSLKICNGPYGIYLMFLLAEVSSLLPHLTCFSTEHREEARSLQTELSEFSDELQRALDEVWAPPKAPEGIEASNEFRADSWAARMAETARRNERRDPRERVQKPEVGMNSPSSKNPSDWKVNLLEI
jgi:elongator complex protein 1